MLEQQMVQVQNIIVENPNIVKPIAILGITGLVYYLKKELFNRVIKKVVNNTSNELDNKYLPFIDRLISFGIWVAGLSFALIVFGVNIQALLTTLGASAIVVAYAFKDTMTNIIAGSMIMADDSFRINDIILLDSDKVQVINIGLRRCKFYSKTKKTIVSLPNSSIAKSKISNLSEAERYKEKNDIS